MHVSNVVRRYSEMLSGSLHYRSASPQSGSSDLFLDTVVLVSMLYGLPVSTAELIPMAVHGTTNHTVSTMELGNMPAVVAAA